MITSVNNGQVKNIIQLNQKTKARREQGLFVAVKKTGCTAHWDGSGDSRESTALRSHGEDGHIRNV